VTTLTPHEVLTAALVQLRDADQATPCQRHPCRVFGSIEEREAASRACAGCPILEPCRAYAEWARESHGVWGGVDRSPKPPGGSEPGPRGPRREKASA
jgi:hypothetical protein